MFCLPNELMDAVVTAAVKLDGESTISTIVQVSHRWRYLGNKQRFDGFHLVSGVTTTTSLLQLVDLCESNIWRPGKGIVQHYHGVRFYLEPWHHCDNGEHIDEDESLWQILW